MLRPHFGEAALESDHRGTDSGAPGERSCWPSLGPST